MPIENPLFQLIGDNDPGCEQDFDLTVEDLRSDGEKGARVTLRLPPRVYNYMAGLAATNRRPVTAEIQAALEAHEALSRMSALLDRDLQEQRRRDSDGVHGVVGETAARMLRMLRRDLASLWAGSFGPAGALDKLGPALAAQEATHPAPDGDSLLRELVPAGAATRQPTLRQAIIRIMRANPGSEWTVADIMRALGMNGWMPRNGDATKRVSDMAAAMADEGHLNRTGRGIYKLSVLLAGALARALPPITDYRIAAAQGLPVPDHAAASEGLSDD